MARTITHIGADTHMCMHTLIHKSEIDDKTFIHIFSYVYAGNSYCSSGSFSLKGSQWGKCWWEEGKVLAKLSCDISPPPHWLPSRKWYWLKTGNFLEASVIYAALINTASAFRNWRRDQLFSKSRRDDRFISNYIGNWGADSLFIPPIFTGPLVHHCVIMAYQ